MTNQEYIEEARELYERGDGDIQVDDDARISRSDVGAYVQAWLWVSAPEEEGH